MKQHIIWTPKFKVGNVIKYFGDIYEITGINQYGYDVSVIEYRDQEDVKTGLGRNVEHIMELIVEYRENKEKKFYPVFRVDVCFSGYAMEDVYIGAVDKDDLVNHLKDILTGFWKEDNPTDEDEYIKEIIEEDYRIKEIDHMFTDNPYTIIESCSYYE